MLPSVELYSIGTELLMGQIQDSNAFWMMQRIALLGGYVRRAAILDDRIEDLVEAFASARDRGARIVVTTGGLGPTPDDMTVEAVAKLIGDEVVVHEELVVDFMKRRDLTKREEVSPALLKMATGPSQARVHVNPAGWAPCVETQLGETVIYNLPGPPREVEAVFTTYIEPVLEELYGGHRATLRVVVNLPESACGPILHAVMEDHPHTYLKAFVALSEKTEDGQRLPVDIAARGPTREEAEALLARALEDFKGRAHQAGSGVEVPEAEEE